MNLKEIIERTTKFFKEKNIESARLDSELLISSALGLRRIDLYLKFEQPLKELELEKCRELVRRRAQGEPVAYILGKKDFYNLSFEVDSTVLIPRPETETLVEIVLDWMRQKNIEEYRVLDLGSGSGCIGLTIAKNEARSVVTMVEFSDAALEVSRRNKESLKLGENVNLVLSRAQNFSYIESSWDVIVANPPYIADADPLVDKNVKKFEPSSALYASQEGLGEIFEWSTKAAGSLKRPGIMIFEIGMTQGEMVKRHFESLGVFDQVNIQKDLSGLDRFIIGEKT
jgi:release factor glutamine methyltransferase